MDSSLLLRVSPGMLPPRGYHQWLCCEGSCTSGRDTRALPPGEGTGKDAAGSQAGCVRCVRRHGQNVSKGVTPIYIFPGKVRRFRLQLHTLAITSYCRPSPLAIPVGFSLWVNCASPWRLMTLSSFPRCAGHSDFFFSEMP